MITENDIQIIESDSILCDFARAKITANMAGKLLIRSFVDCSRESNEGEFNLRSELLLESFFKLLKGDLN